MLKLPYGVSNFTKLANEDYYFVDRTAYIAQLEQMNEPYLFFVRPRRFGKTLFVSMLQCYYGLEYAAQFADIFGNYVIGLRHEKLRVLSDLRAWLVVFVGPKAAVVLAVETGR